MELDWIYRSPRLKVFNTRRGEHRQEDAYGGVNVCHYVGDSPEHVAWSRQQLCAELGISADALIIPRQTHSTNVMVIDDNGSTPWSSALREPLPSTPGSSALREPLPSTPGSSALREPLHLENVDALVTRLRGIAIGVSTADCVPVLLADEKGGVIAAAHAGWRGAIGGIVQRTITTMTTLGANPADMKAWLGPCICQSCFEVGEEVACQFPEKFINYPKSISLNNNPTSSSVAKPHVDLPGYVISLLTQCDLNSSNITPPQACTRCNTDLYFSARRLGIASGRIFSGLAQL